jgi:hypothetical protein
MNAMIREEENNQNADEKLVQSNYRIVFMPLDPNEIIGLRFLSRMKPP